MLLAIIFTQMHKEKKSSNGIDLDQEKALDLIGFVRNQPLNIWIFVVFLNFIAFTGLFYLRSKGIDVYAFNPGTK